MVKLHRTTSDDLPQLKKLLQQRWAGEEMIVHGETFRPGQLEAFVNDDWTGLVTFVITDDGCEIISLDALREGGGIGTALFETVVQEARRQSCGRVFRSTTNDNLHALGYFQRRGFELVGLRRGAIAVSRKQKPAIPLIGDNQIPLRDELELEFRLQP